MTIRTSLAVAALVAARAASPGPAEEATMHAPPAATPMLLEIAARIRSLAGEHPQLARFQAEAAVSPNEIFYLFEAGLPPRRAKVRDDLLRRTNGPLPLAGGIVLWVRWLPDDAMPPQDATTALGRLTDGRLYAVDIRIGAEGRALERRLWKALEDHGWPGCP